MGKAHLGSPVGLVEERKLSLFCLEFLFEDGSRNVDASDDDRYYHPNRTPETMLCLLNPKPLQARSGLQKGALSRAHCTKNCEELTTVDLGR